MATRSSSKPSDKVAAREQLDERQSDGGDDQLEAQAKAQEKEQAAALKAGKTKVDSDLKAVHKMAEKAPAGARSGHVGATATVLGKMDNMSVRSDADALEFHFVDIDRNADGVQDAYKQAGLIRDDKDPKGEYEHSGYYGVYLQPVGALEQDTGIPKLALVRLRDDTNVLVTVPYESLSRADSGRR